VRREWRVVGGGFQELEVDGGSGSVDGGCSWGRGRWR